MHSQNFSQDVSKSIANGQLEKALDMLMEAANDNGLDELRKDVTLLLGRYSNLQRENLQGVLVRENFVIELSRLNSSAWDVHAKIENHLSKKDFLIEKYAEMGEKRTKLIGLYAKYVYQNFDRSIIRQLGGLSSFSIPNRDTEEIIWRDRQGKLSRSKRYHELQLQERRWLENIVKNSYAKLIIGPNVELDQRGDKAKASRIKTLIEFIETYKDSVDIIVSDSVIDLNLLIVGEQFISESNEGNSFDGYKGTEFSWDAIRVAEKIRTFDKRFDELLVKDGLDVYSAKEKALASLKKVLEQLNSSSKSQVYVDQNVHFTASKLGSEELFKFIKYDTVAICLNDKEYNLLAQRLSEVTKQNQQNLDLETIKAILPTLPLDKNIQKENKRAILTKAQYDKLINYVSKGNYIKENFGELKPHDYIIAFSFGEDDPVNKELAETILKTQSISEANLIVQWEIDNFLGTEKKFFSRHRIEKEDKDYLSSIDFVQKAKGILNGNTTRIGIVANSWHAPRCIQICEDEGLDVQLGIFVNSFSSNDPQPWVRDPLSWIIKECQK